LSLISSHNSYYDNYFLLECSKYSILKTRHQQEKSKITNFHFFPSSYSMILSLGSE
jgi:hypothetical protein